MDAFDSRVLREICAEIEQRLDELVQAVALGGLSDHSAYRHQCGVIKGMRDALAIARDIEKQLNGDR